MLTEHEAWDLYGHKGGKPIRFEVNWDKKDEETNQCKIVKISAPDGQSWYIDRDSLNSILFIMGKQEEQPGLLPHIVREVRNYTTMLGITATRDIKKGDKMNVRVSIPLPLSEQQVIGLQKYGNDDKLGKSTPSPFVS